jgi:diguanylate cyclase (GGDEF)-like protein
LLFVLASGRTRALSLVSEKTRELDTKNRELAHQAVHDALTGLPNRTLVLERAEQLLARAAREPHAMTGALFIDIDGFKHVNDNLGHAAGDHLLRIVAQRLRAVVREHDTVGRLGGDEFVVLAEASRDAALDSLAERVADGLREPVEFEDKAISVTASIGVAVGRYPDPDALLRDADLALYAAKAAGKDRYTLFEVGMSSSADARARLERELSAAVQESQSGQESQFFLLYQPLFDLRQRVVVGVEALIRWRHPTKGVVPPIEFVPLAEQSGLIGSIGRWVLDEACRQAAAWAERGLEMGISVNVSAFQVGRKGFVEDVRRSLRDSGLDPSSLTLEITETALMGDLPTACENLGTVRALGVRVAIDDFGTGYASLSNLQRVPVDILKIDMSFVAALNDGAQSRELLQAILGVGEALSLAVVAEGIEDESQMQALLAMGFETGQGFLMAKPSSAEVIEARFGSGSTPLGVARSGSRV